MKTTSLPASVRAIVRETALGLSSEDILVLHPDLTEGALAKVRRGEVFRRALREMQERIDAEMVEQAGASPVQQLLRGKAMASAQTLIALSENEDGKTPHSVREKAAEQVLDRAGFGVRQEKALNPILNISAEKLELVMGNQNRAEMPSSFNGHEMPLADVVEERDEQGKSE